MKKKTKKCKPAFTKSLEQVFEEYNAGLAADEAAVQRQIDKAKTPFDKLRLEVARLAGYDEANTEQIESLMTRVSDLEAKKTNTTITYEPTVSAMSAESIGKTLETHKETIQNAVNMAYQRHMPISFGTASVTGICAGPILEVKPAPASVVESIPAPATTSGHSAAFRRRLQWVLTCVDVKPDQIEAVLTNYPQDPTEVVATNAPAATVSDERLREVALDLSGTQCLDQLKVPSPFFAI
jgi:hypothetical protein